MNWWQAVCAFSLVFILISLLYALLEFLKVKNLKKQNDVDRLIRILKSPDKNNIAAEFSAKALGEIRDMRAIDVLIEETIDGKSKARQRASAKALEQIWNQLDDISIRNEMLRLGSTALKTLDFVKLKGVSLETIREIRDLEAVDPLINLLHDTDITIRKVATQALGEIGDDRAVEPLINLLQETSLKLTTTQSWERIGNHTAKDVIFELRLATIQSLGLIGNHKANAKHLGILGDRRAIEALISILIPPKYIDEIEVVGTALKQLEWQPTSSDENAYFFIALRNWDALSEIGTLAIEPLKRVLTIESQADSDFVAEAAATLGKISFESLFNLHKISRADVVSAGCLKLGEFAINPLIALLKSSDYSVRAFALQILKELSWQANSGSEQGWQLIGENGVLWNEKEYANIAEPSIVEPLVYILSHWSTLDRLRAAHILNRLGWKATNEIEQIYMDIVSGGAFPIHPLAADPLFWFIGYEHSKDADLKATQALEKIMETYANQLDQTLLKLITQTSSRSYKVMYNDICGIDRERVEEVDYSSQLRQLARQELIRRGEPA